MISNFFISQVLLSSFISVKKGSKYNRTLLWSKNVDWINQVEKKMLIRPNQLKHLVFDGLFNY
ncbi:hypothetical protein RV10_GL002256 [Enterococcus pallens]|nr:hypothetical protein RV10_GL002256 [Enterococcus pallens]